nr:5'-nucleotidase C-terminal domain-containing protein [uncultured Cellulosilyticum sp.]
MAKFLKAGKVLCMAAAVAMQLVLPTNIIFAAESESKTIQIVATSDLHGQFYGFEYATNSEVKKGGLTRVATVVKELKAQNPNTIVVDNGDTIQGNSSQLFFEDEAVHPMIAGLNAIDAVTMTLGNHEFNYGVETLEKVLSGFEDTKVLAANVYKPNGERLVDAYRIVEVDGVRIAIIGTVTPNIVNWDASKLVGYKVTTPLEETQKAIKEIKDGKLADIMIAAVHMGKDGEYGDDSAAEIAEKCPELTAVIAGHEHAVREDERVNNIPITEPGTAGNYVSVVEITVDKNNKVEDVAARLISTEGVEPDAELTETLKPYHEKALADAQTVIGKLESGALVPEAEMKGVAQGQLEDNALVDLILEVQTYYAEQSGKIPAGAHHVSGAALFSASANVQPGEIKRSDTANMYKYDNTLKTLKINGKQLKEYMEWSASYYNTFKDGDLNISFNPDIRIYNYDMFSGVRYDIDVTKEAGSRITNLRYRTGHPVKDTDEIYLTVNNYRCDSVLLPKLFADAENVEVVYDNSTETVSNIRELMADYIENVKGGVITPTVDKNWKLIGYKIDAEKAAIAKQLVNEGKLELPTSEDGRTPNVKSLTWADVEAVLNAEEAEANKAA